jgi:hypothetical protein
MSRRDSAVEMWQGRGSSRSGAPARGVRPAATARGRACLTEETGPEPSPTQYATTSTPWMSVGVMTRFHALNPNTAQHPTALGGAVQWPQPQPRSIAPRKACTRSSSVLCASLPLMGCTRLILSGDHIRWTEEVKRSDGKVIQLQRPIEECLNKARQCWSHDACIASRGFR